jgi:hypothetical protein
MIGPDLGAGGDCLAQGGSPPERADTSKPVD